MNNPLLEQARHNEAALDLFCSTTPDFYDWKFVMLYYAALHYMKAWLLGKGYNEQLETHYDVLNLIKTHGPFFVKKHIFQGYKALHTRSNNYRYEQHVLKIDKAVQQADYATAYSDFIAIKKCLGY